MPKTISLPKLEENVLLKLQTPPENHTIIGSKRICQRNTFIAEARG
jgi:hypothetical protein